ncbi:MAG: arginine--tRNA ligase [Ignavibacteriae bacterium]|nr:MAG: arginine--tRNA ligase [Ignavibacteriota bacterium]
MKKYLAEKVGAALVTLSYDTTTTPLVFDKPKDEAHGDITTNIAMLLAKAVKKNPRLVGQEIVGRLEIDPKFVSKVEIAGPGFINFSFTDEFFTSQIGALLAQSEGFGKINTGGGKKTQVEYVSANPTGPLSVGHGRQAAVGDTIANILVWAGYDVTREYYYNNAGRQMRLLAESTYARYRQLFDDSYGFPEEGYQGDYIRHIAEDLKKLRSDSLIALPMEEALSVSKDFAEQELFQAIKKVLARMGVVHDVFFNEDSLYKTGKIEEVISEFRRKDLAYDQDGAVWLKTTALGLDQDRVIVKSTGEPTYRLPDIAYHREKFRRGFELIVDVFGADHIATIPDVLAGVKALGYDPEKVKVVIHQFVTLKRDGEQVKMSKRLANFVTLDELIDEVGSDAVRFFFLMRSTSSHLEFDLNLAKEQSEKNPVYYLQYAHARIASILRFAEEQGTFQASTSLAGIDYTLLKGPAEIALTKLLLDFPETIELCSQHLEPHRLTTYLQDVAAAFHKFYHEHRIVIPERELANARLALCLAAKTVLANGCKILGISAPERM